MVRRFRGVGWVAFAATGALVLAACGGGDGDSGADGTGDAGGQAQDAQAGGTLTYLQTGEQFQHVDPQRVYTGEDLAFFGAYITRSLTQFTYSSDPDESSAIVGDLATDTGTSNEDATEWSFTIRDGVKWEDGSDVTCEDVKYGVSRTFAQDVITDGPTYAISFLDIPEDPEGGSAYKGPYTGDGQELYDEAVTCDGNTITFKLAFPVADFNYATTLHSFAPVQEAKDTGESYDDAVQSNGPYKIEEYTIGQQMVLVRNDQWNAESDPDRPAYPDRIEVKFALESAAVNQRLIQDAPADQNALASIDVLPENKAAVFSNEALADRRWDEFSPYTLYYAIDTTKVPNVKHRQAILAAMNRETIIAAYGGDFAGEEADGVVKPNIGADYAPTEVWDGLLGQEIPPQGDPEYAKQLIEESGEPLPELRLSFRDSDTESAVAAAFIEALARADITVQPNSIERSQYYGTVLGDGGTEIMFGGWGPDWSNASTVLPELFGTNGGFNLSYYDDEEFQAAIADAQGETDRAAQTEKWHAISKASMEAALVAPWLFEKEQRIWGSGLKNVEYWPAYGSYLYANIAVTQ
jgi:peptide/nickel transport system substrate-binding protein